MPTATNPTTGERLQYVAGAWIPLGPAPGLAQVEAAAPAAPEEPGLVGRYVTDPFLRGIGSVATALGGIEAGAGLTTPKTAAAQIAAGERYRQQHKQTAADEAGTQAIGASKTVPEFLGAVIRHFPAAVQMGAESLGTSVPSIVGGGIGALLQGPLTSAAGVGLGSAGVEFGLAISGPIQEAGVDLQDTAKVERIIADPKFMALARERAVKRGVAVGTFDALAGLMAGKFVRGATGVPSFLGRGAAEIAGQGVAGGAGEAVAEKATGEPLQVSQIAPEVLFEVPGGIVETGTGYVARRNDPAVAAAAARVVQRVKQGAPGATVPPPAGTGPATAPPPGTTTPPPALPVGPGAAPPPTAAPAAAPGAPSVTPPSPIVTTPPAGPAIPPPSAAPGVTTPPKKVTPPSRPSAAPTEAPVQDVAIRTKAEENAAAIIGEQPEWEPVNGGTHFHNTKTGKIVTAAEHLAPIATPLSTLDPTVPSPAEVAAAPEGELAVAPEEKPGPLQQPGVAPETGAGVPPAPIEAFTFPPSTEPAAAPTAPALPPTAAAPAPSEAPAPEAVPPQQLEPPPPVKLKPGSFRTAQGSTYEPAGEGSTRRFKTPHPGHPVADVGWKKPSERTVYVDPEDARKTGMFSTQNGEKRVAILADGTVGLLGWNEQAKEWGISPGDRFPFTTKPEVGKAPIEVWQGEDDKRGRFYSSWHPGNPITEIGGEQAGPIKPPAAKPPSPQRATQTEADADSISLVGEKVQKQLQTGQRLDLKDLRAWMEDAFGGTQAQGVWDSSDMNEAVEVGFNLASLSAVQSNGAPPNWPAKEARRRAVAIDNAISKTPTQTRRTDEKVAFQQFSTPPDYAMAVAWAANIRPKDVVLEPSAGTGSLAAWAGTNTIVNELSDRRRQLLDNMGFKRIFGEDAEQLDNILPEDVKPTVILMNPPFSAAGKRGVKKDITIGAGHIWQALKRLEDGGRLVAIVGRGMGMDAVSFKSWWENVAQTYNVRANIGVSGDVYAKYGTSFGTRVLVIDKTGPTTRTILQGEVATIPDLISALEEVRGARAGQAERPAQPAGGAEAARPGGAPRPVQPPAPDTGGVAAGERRPTAAPAAGGRPAKPAVEPKPEGAGRPEPAAGGHAPAVPGGGPPAGGAPGPGEAAGPAGERGGAAGAEPGGGRAEPGAGELAAPGEAAPGAQPAVAPALPTGFGSKNTVFSKDDFEESLAAIKAMASPTTLRAGFDPAIMFHGARIAGYLIEGGIRSFVDYAKKATELLGDKATPELLEYWYGSVRRYPGFDATGMDSEADVQAYLRLRKQETDSQKIEEEQKPTEETAPVDPKEGTTMEEDPSKEPTAPAAEQTKQEISGDDVFEVYAPPKLTVKGAKPHPTALVESAAMASVKAPELTYKPHLPQALIDAGELSDVQLESIAYAGQAHQRMLQDNETRRGFFIGDGTGVGKGRQNAAIILDNWAQGKKRAIWFSQSQKLYNDALRDWTALGGDGGDIFNLSKTKAGGQVAAKQGVMYATYKTLSMGAEFQTDGSYSPISTTRGKYDLAKGDQIQIGTLTDPKIEGQRGVVVSAAPVGGRRTPKFKIKLASGEEHEVPRGWMTITKPAGKATEAKARIDQIVNWVGPDFDGAIVFDESHLMGNAVAIKGKLGTKQPSQIAMAGVALQQKFPKARIVYASATGATEVANLSYAVRLGLWGEGTAFPTRMDFINKISAGGVAAMELVARDLKAQGSYLARGLSMKGVTYERLEHEITPDQTEIYDKLAEAWQLVLANIKQALEDTGQAGSGKAKQAAMGRFWSSNQRFWNQVLISMQSPSMIAAIEKDLAAGNAPVLQLVNTNEEQQERALEDQSEDEVLDLDLTPRDILIELIEKAYPTQQYEEVATGDGKTAWVPVFDSEGKPVQNKDAVAAKAKLIDELSSIRTPLAPLEMVFQAFPASDIAEATGRSRRVEFEGGKQVLTKRSPATMEADIADFQADRKKMIVFSDAGGTGASYHADLGAKNQRLRRHYLVQAGWRADKAVQGFGRTHRTNQKQPPEYVLVTTNLQGQKRFISSIARRLAQLGALTKGQRQTTEGMFSERDNLESDYAELAVRSLIRDIARGDLMPEISWQNVEVELGLDNLIDPKTGAIQEGKLPPVSKFLNRILSVTIARQNKYFEAFMQRLDANVAAAAERGELDTGLQTIKTVSAKKTRDVIAHTDPATGAEAHYLEIDAEVPRKRMTFKQVSGSQGFAVELKTGRIWAYGRERSHTDARTGRVATIRSMQGPLSGKAVETTEFDDASLWEKVRDQKQAQAMWKELYAKTPASRPVKFHLMSGSLLPIWDRLPTSGQVVRMQLDNGDVVLGRELTERDLQPTLDRLGVGTELPKLTTAEAVRAVTDGAATLTLANRWTIQQRRVGGEPRIEVVGPDYRFEGELFPAGVFAETHQYRKRYFIPTGAAAEKAMTAVIKARPIAKVSYPGRQQVGEEGETPLAKSEGGLPGEAGQAPAERVARIFGENYPSAQDERDRIRDEVAKEIGRIAGPEAETEVHDTLWAEMSRGETISVHGGFAGDELGGVIAVALRTSAGERLTMPQILGSARHEAIHFLRHTGAIPDEHWRALEAKARSWRQLFNIDLDPAYRAEPEEIKNEEGIAKAFDAWSKGELKLTPQQNAAMRFLKRIFDAVARGVKRALGLKTLPSAEEVFKAIEAGEFAGQRSEQAARDRHMLASTGLGPGTMTTPVDLREQMRQLSALNYGLLQKALRPGMRGKAGHVFDHFRRFYDDRFLFVRRVEEAAEAALGRPLSESERAYLAEEGYYSKVGDHKLRLQKDYFEPIVKLMHDHGINREEVDEYLMARHAPERNAQIASINPLFPATGPDAAKYGSGMTDTEAADIIAAVPAAEQPGLEQIHDLVRGMMEQRLDWLVQSGLMSASEAAAYRATYDDYVPLRGVEADPLAEDEDALKFPTGRGFMGSRAKEKRAFGRQSRAPDVLATAMAMADAAYVRGEKNLVAQALLNLARAAPDPKVWSVNPREREAYLAKDRKTGVETVRYRYRPHYSGQDTVSVRVNGREFRIELKDPALLRAFSNMGGRELGPVMSQLSRINGLLSKLNTMYSPEFLVANAQMDFETAMVNLGREDLPRLRRDVTKLWKSAGIGTFHYIRTGKTDTPMSAYAAEFRRAGGATAFNPLSDVSTMQLTVDKALKQLNSPSGWRRTGMPQMFKLLDEANTAVDNAVRLATYVVLRQRGYSAARAASAAKNLTINFNRKGEAGPAMNALFMFANAGIQGSSVLASAMMRSPKVRRFVYGTVALGMTSELLLGALPPPDDDDKGDGRNMYDQIKEWEKKQYMIIPYGIEPGQYVKIRMPYGYAFFHNLGRLMAAYVRGAQEDTGKPVSLGETAVKIMSAFADNMIPPGLGDTLVPTVAQPFVDLWKNKDWLTRPIMPTRYPGQTGPESQRYFPSVNPISRVLAEKLNEATGGNEFRSGLLDISPEAFSHIVSTYAGGAGRILTQTGNRLWQAGWEANGGNVEDPHLSWKQLPFLRKAIGEANPFQARDVTYQRMGEIETLADEAKSEDKAFAQKVRRENRRLLALTDDSRKLRRELGQIRKQRLATKANDKLATAEKRRRIDRLEEREGDLMTRFNRAYMRALTGRSAPSAAAPP